MSDKAPVIEINGRKYNADTGQQLSSGQVQHETAAQITGRVIDGFAAPHKIRKRPDSAAKLHKHVQRTKKLHPLAAQAPVKGPLQSVSSRQIDTSSSTPVDRNQLVAAVRADRQKRAQQQAKSDKISKFSSSQATEAAVVSPAVPSLQVAPPPATYSAPVMPKPARAVHDDKEKTDRFAWFKNLRSKRPRLLPTAAVVTAVLLVAGYVTYLNLPNMALRVAASRAGFDAKLPGYTPSGFHFDGPVAYAPGQVTIKFTSNSDSREFTLHQRESTWDSQSLLANFLEREGKKPVTFQERGLTIYVYDNDHATWVDGGVWYTISGDSLLSSEQLTKIAGSL